MQVIVNWGARDAWSCNYSLLACIAHDPLSSLTHPMIINTPLVAWLLDEGQQIINTSSAERIWYDTSACYFTL